MGENRGRRKESNECQMELNMLFDSYLPDKKHDYIDEDNMTDVKTNNEISIL